MPKQTPDDTPAAPATEYHRAGRRTEAEALRKHVLKSIPARYHGWGVRLRKLLSRRIRLWYGMPFALVLIIGAHFLLTRWCTVDVTLYTRWFGTLGFTDESPQLYITFSPTVRGWFSLKCNTKLFPDASPMGFPETYGFHYFRMPISADGTEFEHQMLAPQWVLLLPMVPLILWSLRRRQRSRKRRWRESNGLCLRCGYDIRSSPHRCPECGTAAARQPAAPAGESAVSRV